MNLISWITFVPFLLTINGLGFESGLVNVYLFFLLNLNITNIAADCDRKILAQCLEIIKEIIGNPQFAYAVSEDVLDFVCKYVLLFNIYVAINLETR